MTPFDLFSLRLLETLESVKPQIISFFKIKLLLRLLKHSFDYHKSQQTYFSLAQKLLFLENFYDMSTNWSANTRDISSPRGSALLLMLPRKILIKEVVLVEVAFKAAGQHYLSLGMQSGPPEEDQKNTTRLLYTPTQQRIASTYQFATIINFTRFTCCSTSEFQITSSTPPRLLFFFCWFLILWNLTIGLCVHYSIWKLEGVLYTRISETLFRKYK